MTVEFPIFSQGVGYGIIIGVGAGFALGMSLVSWGLSRYLAEKQTVEMFMTAKHSVKTGMIASAVVSSWTIVATLLSSATAGYNYGVSGPFWYGAGASVQILLFSIAAIELKRKAPHCHTFLELVRIRYGAGGHIPLLCYSLFFQLFQSVNLLVGGSAVYATFTGVNRDAACFLFPIGVVIYTLFGGIKATFLTDWVHTVVIYVIMLSSLFTIYATSSVLGSADKVWELLRDAATLHPVENNAGGSYLTMKSQGGGFIGLIFIGAGFAAAVDSQLFQKAIAADPRSTLGGYLLGGTCWFTIPFVLATTFGLAAAATEHLSIFPTYPRRMTSDEVSNGMAMPYAAIAVMGKGGGVAVLLLIFMAVTSALSSETVATAALLTYDIYQAYIHPIASGKQLIRVSHSVVIGFALLAAGIAVGFNHAGFSVNYIITAIGIFVDSAIVPMACTIMWKQQSKAAVIVAPLASSAAAIMAWLLTTWKQYGVLSIETTSQNLPLVAGNMMSLTGPILLTPLVTWCSGGQNFDWAILKEIRREEDEKEEGENEAVVQASVRQEAAGGDAGLLTARRYAIFASIFLVLAYLIFWPIPMYGSGYVFSKDFFRGWIVVTFLWAFFAISVITLLPIWEGRAAIRDFFRFMFAEALGKRRMGVVEGVESVAADDRKEDIELKREEGSRRGVE